MSQYVPVIILAGQSGAGKDTVGDFLRETYNAITLGQADPIKRFLQKVFDFTDEQLWGDRKNDPDPRYHDHPGLDETLAQIERQYEVVAEHWFRESTKILSPILTHKERLVGLQALDNWLTVNLKIIARGKTLSPRKLLQTLGTEWGRDIHRDIWITIAKRTAHQLLMGGFDYDRILGLTPGTGAPDYVVICDGRFRNEILSVKQGNGVALKLIRPSITDRVVGHQGHQSETELTQIPDHFYTNTIQNAGTKEQLYDSVARHMILLYGDGRGAPFLL